MLWTITMGKHVKFVKKCLPTSWITRSVRKFLSILCFVFLHSAEFQASYNYSCDFDAKLIAMRGVTYDSDQRKTNVHIIEDYTSNILYYINLDQNVCSKEHIALPLIPCIPGRENVKMLQVWRVKQSSAGRDETAKMKIRRDGTKRDRRLRDAGWDGRIRKRFLSRDHLFSYFSWERKHFFRWFFSKT